MNRILISFLVIVALHASASTGLAADAPPAVPNYDSMANVAEELQFINDIWHGNGVVLVGRLDVPQDTFVARRIPIRDDGSYCTAIYMGRKLIFFAHGYEPLKVSRYSKIATKVYDTGLQTFVRAKPEDIRSLKGRVTARGLEDDTRPITCDLEIRNEEYLSNDSSYSGGAAVAVTVGSQELSIGRELTFNQLSRIPYVLVVTAPGYITQELKIDQDQDGVIDLGEIVLEPSTIFNISYKARVRQNGGEWIGDDSVKTVIVACDGDSKFRFTDQRDGVGNRLALRMRPKEGAVEASFFYYKPDSFFELGSSNAQTIPDWDKVDTSALKGSAKAILQDGKQYYFTIDDVSGTDIQLLFQVAARPK